MISKVLLIRKISKVLLCTRKEVRAMEKVFRNPLEYYIEIKQ